MRVHSSTRYLALLALAGALACASNPEPDEAAAARDTTQAGDTLAGVRDTLAADTVAGEVQPGYRGMERDTTLAPPAEQTPTDTFIQQQGQGQPQDTAGYTGMERVDTTGQADTTGYGRDTSGMGIPDTTGAVPDTGMTGLDTSQTGQPADTTGYNPSQDTTTAR